MRLADLTKHVFSAARYRGFLGVSLALLAAACAGLTVCLNANLYEIWPHLGNVASGVAGIGAGAIVLVVRSWDAPPGACANCGYPLDGLSPGSDRCPECGNPLAQRRIRRRRYEVVAAWLVVTVSVAWSLVALGVLIAHRMLGWAS